MKSLASWMFTIFAIMFWTFRVVLAVVDGVGGSLGVPLPDSTFEVILLFVFLPCILLIVKRKVLGGLIYFGTYATYFGTDIYNHLKQLLLGEQLGTQGLMSLFVSTLGVAISFLVLADLVLNKNRANKLGDKKTDWFFKNEDYDRQYDERADRNQYKTR